MDSSEVGSDFWVDDEDRLYHVTTWGAEGVARLESLNLLSTVRVNTARGIEFSLRTKARDK